MAVTAREVPDIARTEIDDLRQPERVDGGDAAAPIDDIGPFGGIGVPVQLAQGAGLKRHVNAGELVGDREALHVRLLRRAAIEGFRGDGAEMKAEGRQLGPGKRRW